MNFFKSFGIYTIAGFVSKGISFLLLPFFTHYLTQSDYGIITIFSNSLYFIAPLMNMGIGETLTVEHPRLTKNEISTFISTSIIIPSIIVTVVLIVNFFFHVFFSELTGLSESILYLLCFLSFFNFFSEYLFSILRNQNKPIFFGVLTVVKTILELALAVYFIRFCHEGYIGRVKSIFLNTLIIALFSLFYFFRKRLIVMKFSTKWMAIILKRGMPTIPLFFMMFIMYNCDTYMINYYFGAAKAGVYGLACQFAFLLTVITSSFITPFYPFLYENLLKGDHAKVVKLVVRYLLFISGVFVLILLLAPFVVKVFIAQKFQNALYYLFFLLLGQYFYSFYLILAGLIFYKKQNHFYYFICPLVIAFSIGINYFLLHVIKVQQFALASAFSYIFCFIVVALIYFRNIKSGVLIFWRSLTNTNPTFI